MNKALRKAVIAGNWKMNKTPSEAKALIEEMKPLVKDADCDVVLCVPYIDIPAAVEAAKGSNIKIGAENIHFKASGAFTYERFRQICSRKQELNMLLSVTRREEHTSVKPTRPLTFVLLLL